MLAAKRRDAAPGELAAVRPLVEREVLAERRKAELQALYERLLAKYSVGIDLPVAPVAPVAPVVLGASGNGRGAP